MKSRMRRSLFRAWAAGRVARFEHASHDPLGAQRAALRAVLQATAGSEYGAAHRLNAGLNYEDFAARVPVVEYEDLRPWIEEQARTGRPMLTADAPVVYEATSGSTGRRKLVPYTRAMLQTFSDWFLLWSDDLLGSGPGLNTGKIFLSTSPALRAPERTPSGVPVSFPDDTGFLSPMLRRSWARSFFMPLALGGILDPQAYRRSLAALLLAEPELEVAFIWSPTYFLSLLDFVSAERDLILADFDRGFTGTTRVPLTLPPLASHRRALLLRDAIPWQLLWPRLQVISCWADASAAGFAAMLARRFPEARLQPKGLLATEAAITLPLWDSPAPVPCIDTVVLEFERGDGSIHRVHELEEGGTYAVIVSQPGGLLRYRMHDRVTVTGRHRALPCLRFAGRDNLVGDMAGEKLGESFVRGVLDDLFGPDAEWSYLEPVVPSGGPAFYRCVTDAPAAREYPDELAHRLEVALSRVPHYAYARALAQLAHARVRWTPSARREYESACLDKGASWGGIKFGSLLPSYSRCAPSR